ncbi:proline-rich small protein YnaL [Dryocola sp. BD626]|jgi:hypothetical protein|uniref:proline-rich small protein YnaL n=1 Tax=Dryocola sp. BD626 TaxID=3133273 RepID=UPI003F5091EE
MTNHRGIFQLSISMSDPFPSDPAPVPDPIPRPQPIPEPPIDPDPKPIIDPPPHM